MKVILTTNDLNDFYFRLQVNSLLAHNVIPDAILIHKNGFEERIKNHRQNFKQFRIEAINFYFKNIIRKFNHRNIQPETDDFNQYISYNDKITSQYLNQSKKYFCKPINHLSTTDLLKNLSPCIVACNSGIVRKEVLQLAEVIFLNVHIAKLPMFRGINNIEWTLFHQEPLYATIHRISEGIDEGDILLQEPIVIHKKLVSIEAYRKYCFQMGYSLIGKAVSKFLKKEISFRPQSQKRNPLMQYYVLHPILKSYLQNKLDLQ